MSAWSGQTTIWDSAGGGGGGAVDSVNSQTGVVVLGASDVGAQPSDADLLTYAGITPSALGQTLLALASSTAGRTALGVTIGTDVAAYDAGLASLAAADTAADLLTYTTAANAWSATAFTSTARSLLDDTSTGAMRTTLGLAIGTDVLAYDAGLASLITVDTAADLLPYTTAANTWASASLTSFGRSLIDDAAATNARTTLGLVIGTDVQAYDADLAAIAALTSAADKLPYFTGSGTAALATFSAFARTYVDDADAATTRATLGVGPSTDLDDATNLAFYLAQA